MTAKRLCQSLKNRFPLITLTLSMWMHMIVWGKLKTLVRSIFPYMLALCLSISGKGVIAQSQASVDSLRQLFFQPFPDTLRISTILSVEFKYLLLEDPPALLHYHSWIDSICRARLQSPSGLSRKDKKYYTRSLGTSLHWQGFYYHRKVWNAEKALQYYEEALVHSREVGYLPIIGNALNNIANIFEGQGDIPTTLEYYLKAREVWEQLSDKTGLAICLDDIGKLYTTQGDLPKAKEFTQLALQECRKADIPGTEAMALMHLGNIYTLERKFSSAEACLVQSLAIVEQFENYVLIALAHRYWAILLEAEGKIQEALEAHHRGLAWAEKASYDKGISLSHLYIGKIQYGQQHLADALFHANQSLQYAEQTGIVLNIKHAVEFLSKLHEESGDPGKALQYYKYSIVIKDSLFNEKNRSSMIRQQMQYDFDKKEAITLREKKIQRIILMAFAALLLFTSISTIVIFRNLRIKARQNKIIERQNQKMEYKNQQIMKNNRMIQDQSEILKDLDKLKSRFFTNIAHEFRTPLTVILGMSQNIRDNIGAISAKAIDEHLKMVQRNGKHLLNLVNQMLDLSKLDSGRLNMQWELGDVVLFLQYLSESFYSYAVTKKIQLAFHSEVRSLEMDFDRKKLQHIVSNLLSNAFKFTPQGGKVVFHAQQIPSEKNTDDQLLQFKISNIGPGISEEHLPHIFDRFYQADDTLTRQSDGTGIGLALTKDLVVLLDGSITVKSEPGKWTTFTVLLPIRKTALPSPDPLQIEPTMPLAEIKPDELTASAPLTDDQPLLLLIEDNADVATYITSCMKDQYTVLWAENGRLGIDKALETIPDIIISDVMMPEKDGYEVTRFLKNDERTSHIPIILLTAKATIEDRITGLERGADAYLSKPFDKKELLVRVDQLVTLREQLQAYYAKGAVSDSGQAVLPETDIKKDVQIENVFLRKVNEIIKEHLSEAEFEIPQLSRELAMSHSQLYRKIKALTGQSIAAYIRSYRLHQGRILLQTTNMTVSQIAYEVGFTAPSYFSQMYLDVFGESPSSARN